MPTYDYKCPACKSMIEVVHSIHDKPYMECKDCNLPMAIHISMKKGIHFKGSGFYETDYKNK